MIVPLAVKAYGNNLVIIQNKQIIRKELPFKPYTIVERPNKFLKSNEIRTIRIPDNIEVTMYKMESDDVKTNEDKAKQLLIEGEHICKLPYTEQLYVDQPDYILQYPNTQELDILYLDIEVLTIGDGIFPRAKDRPIIAIGCKHNTNRVQIFDNYTRNNDRNILNDFLEYYRQVDPDIIVTYNGDLFDLPYIIERMMKFNIDLNQLGRYGKTIYKEGSEFVEFNGRIHFDCIHPARKDQSLFGAVKSRSLKDVSKWYGHNALSLDDDIGNTQKLVGTQQLKDYLESDVEATKVVADVYLPNMISLAEIVKVPLDAVSNSFSSFIPKLICARNCKKLNLQPLDNNKQRYGHSEKDENGKPTGIIIPGRLYNITCNFQGALVDLYKTEYIPKLWKLDFTAYYPSAIRTWNLGPDTTRITNVTNFTGKYSFRRSKTNLILNVPDDNFNKNIEITIDMSKVGFLKAEIETLTEERKRLKVLLKNAVTKADTESYESRQLAIKVINNCFVKDTDVLLTDKVEKIQNIKVGDIAYSINPLTFKLEKKKVISIIKQKAPEILYESKSSKTHNIITGNHNIFTDEGFIFAEKLENKRFSIPIHKVNNKKIDEFIYLNEFINIENYEFFIEHKDDLRTLKHRTKFYDIIKTPSNKRGSVITKTLTTKEIKYLENFGYRILIRNKRNRKCGLISVKQKNKYISKLIGYYISEGNLYESKYKKYENNNIRGISKKITISQFKNINPEIYNNICNTIYEIIKDNIHSSMYKEEKAVSFSSDVIYEFLNILCGKGKDKYLNDIIFDKFDINEIRKTAYEGDGTKNIKLYSCQNTYPKMLFSILKLYLECGVTPRNRIDNNTNRISWNEDNLTIHGTKKINNIENEYVYCIMLEDNHTIYAGLNGRFCWIGQSIFGFLGNEYATYGDLASSIAITAMCRWTTRFVLDKLGDSSCQLDTDGVIVDKFWDVNILNEEIAQYIKDHQGVKSYMLLECDDLLDGYFYKMKNYAVRKIKKGKTIIEKHGVSFKSSKQAAICDTILNTVCEDTLNRSVKDELLRSVELRNFAQYPLNMFKFKINLTKNLEEYAEGSQQRALGIQIEERLKTKVEKGMQIDYYVTKEPPPCDKLIKMYVDSKKKKDHYYSISQYVTSVNQLDMKYYNKQIDKIFKIFNWNINQQMSLL